MTISPTRRDFQASVELVREHTLDDWQRAPLFFTPLESLPRPERAPLAPSEANAAPGPLRTISQASEQIASGELSASALLEEAIAAIETYDAALNAFVTVAPLDELRAEAAKLDAERAEGKLRGPLHGIPISVKDVIHAAGLPSTASSALLEGNIAKYDATGVHRLRDAGALIIGKVQTHEFALGVTTPQSKHPLDQSRNPGGSSGGSAISIATGMSLGSLGTDTRASIRVPSALCGLVGYKPTYGRIPTDGVITLSWSLDHLAPMASTVGDCALLIDVLSEGAIPASEARPASLKGLKIGVPSSALLHCEPDVLAVFEQALAKLREEGAELLSYETPLTEDFDEAVSMGLMISRCEAAAYHRSFGNLHENRNGYTRPVYEQLDEAQQVSAVDYLHAQRARAALRERTLATLYSVDAMIMPTCPVVAPPNSEVENYFLLLSQNCILWSFIGVPALSVPCGTTPIGLPVGMQIVAGPYEDTRLLAIAAGIEAILS